MSAMIRRLWSALRSLFRRKRYVTIARPEPPEEMEERLNMELDRIMEEDRKKKEYTPGPDMNGVYLRGKYEKYCKAFDRKLKKAKKVQMIAMHHPRIRIRKKNLNRLGREITKVLKLYFKTKKYATVPICQRKEETYGRIDAGQEEKEAGVSMVDMPEVRTADHLGEDDRREVNACEPCAD